MEKAVWGRAMRLQEPRKIDDFALVGPSSSNSTKLTALFFLELFRSDQARS
jgi:hypothetical protein